MIKFFRMPGNYLFSAIKKRYVLFLLVVVLFSIKLSAQPVINSFSPTSGPVGTAVTIKGNNFSANWNGNTVFFGVVKATVIESSTTTLKVTVPAGATFQPITVSAAGMTAYSAKPFIVTFFGAAPEFTSASFDYLARVDSVDSETETTKYAIGDLNNDGKMDVVTIDRLSNKMVVYTNNTVLGDVTFTKWSTLSTGTSPRSVAVADIDSDGQLDIIVTNLTENTVSVFRNRGFGIFGTKVDFATAFQPSGIAVADIDKDGKPDLVINTVNLEGYVSVLRNTGTWGIISFAPKIDIQSFGGSLETITVADIDGDGKRDIAVPNYGLNAISIFKNTSTSGNISFASKIDIGSGQYPYAVDISDLNDDGKPDMSVHYFLVSDKVSVFRNTSSSGNISFAGPNSLSTGNTADAITVSDLNGDGKPDLAVQSTWDSLSVFKNISASGGAIQFSPFKKIHVPLTGPIFAGDFDGDGRPDITFSAGVFRVMIWKNKTNYPQITSFSPSQARQGDTVTISGVNFNGVTLVSFGETPSASFKIIDSTTIKAIVSNGSSGSISVSVSWLNQTHSLEGFVFAAPPTIRSFSPDSAATGSKVTITGSNFIGVSGVSFGGVPASSFTVVNSTTITAFVGNGASGSVTLVNRFGTTSLAGFSYIQPVPTITSFAPTVAASGTTIQISGTNFSGTTAISFGGIPASSFTIVSPTSVKAVVGEGATGNVSLTTPVGTALRAGFTYIPPPLITSFTPTSAASWANVTISGSNLIDVKSVSFGGVPAYSFSIVNETTIRAVLGEGASGDVVVISNSGKSSLSGFTYLPPPTINSFSPKSGPIGTTVTITGTNFTGATSVSFSGTVASSFTIVSSDTIRAVAGVGISGNISVNTPTGWASSSEPYTFIYPPPTITSFSPLSATKGNSITIIGTNFIGYPSVSFGGVAANSVTVNSPTRITATVGEGASGDVSVTTWGGTALLSGFTYKQPPPSINQFIPYSGTAGTAVTISGNYFNEATSITFGGTPASSFIVNSNTSITAIVGAGSSGKVAVTTPGGTSSDSYPFTYSAPLISSFSPTSGEQGTVITIKGSDFYKVSSVRFGGVPAASYTVDSDTSMRAVVGSGSSGDVSVVGEGVTATLPGFTFISPTIVIKTVSPAIAANGTKVTITGYNFTGATAVSFGGVPAKSFVVNSISNITAVVGAGASGFVSVTTNTGTATFDGFVYTNAPLITSFTPESATTGSPVTINGANFNSSAAENVVYFGVVKASIISASPDSLVVSVPVAATYQPITVTSNGLTGYSQKFFNTTFTAIGSISETFLATKIDSATGSTPNHVSIGDIDNDGKIDVTASNYSIGAPVVNIAVLKNNAVPESISFEPKKLFKSSVQPSETLYADIDGDGKLDMIVANANDGKPASIFQNLSSGGVVTYAKEYVMPGGSRIGEFYVAVGDLNGDGKPEVCTVGAYSGAIDIFKNISTIGNISFAAPVAKGVGQYPQNMVLTDVDMDGKLDFVVMAGRRLPDFGAATVLRNTSNADTISFAAPVVFYANRYTRRLAVGDLDGDGRNDVVLTNEYSNLLTTFRNISTPGNISFDNKIEYLTKPGPYGVTIADLNGNGKPEMIVTNIYNSSISVFNNTSTLGSISFSPKIEFATGAGPKAVTVGDFDSDGRPDIATANSEAGTISFLRNQISGIFITSFTPSSATEGTVVTITGTNLTGATGVSFGGIPALSFTVNSSTSITAVVGTGASGNVSVTTLGGIATLVGFTFIPQPTITSFIPTSAAVGASITITGTNFTGATAVSFGSIAATSFTVNSSTSITAVVGTGASGNVSVTTAGGVAALAGFTFIPMPSITSFTPKSCGTGTSVTITGTNFTAATAVSFGGIAATSFTVNSATTITAMVGTGASGNVSVITPGGTATLAGFTFMSPPTITSFTPEKGRTGITVAITGTNFNETTGVSFGGVPAASFIINSSTSISAVIGAGASGDITVTTPYGVATAGGFAFEVGRGVNELMIYPNPADEFVLIKHPSTDLPAQLKIIDLTGKVVRVIIPERNASETRIDLKSLKQGIYEVVWSDGKNKASQKLMLYK